MTFSNYIRIIPDFPKKGIGFYDISPLLANPVAWKEAIMELKDQVSMYKPEYLVGVESRGFLITAPLAYELGLGFIMIRKKGKLPGNIQEYSYDLEYGQDTLEIQVDLMDKGKRVVILDDVMATGGTLSASVTLLKQVGFQVAGACCLMELKNFQGAKKVEEQNVPFFSLLHV